MTDIRSNPTLSIITVSAFDSARLENTLTSLAAASSLSFEHITVLPENDVESRELWERLCGKLHNFKLTFDKNLGIYPAMNLGASFAKGIFIVFWNGGERVTSESQMQELLSSLDSTKSNTVISQGEVEWLPNHLQNSNEFEGFILSSNGKFISHQTYFLRLDYFMKLGRFNESYTVVADTDLMLRDYGQGLDREFLNCRPVFVENSRFASANHRIARLEMLKLNLLFSLRTGNVKRLRNFLSNELVWLLRKVENTFELRGQYIPVSPSSDSLPEKEHYKSNFGREKILNRFASLIAQLDDEIDIKQINVIGGSTQDPEATYLINKFPKARISTYGIEDSDFYLDLNMDNYVTGVPGEIVLVSQVLEHIWDHNRFFKEILKLTQIDGLIWIGCPASNKVHGSPDYFASGMTSTYLRNNLLNFNAEILDFGFFGTKRLYLATHWIPGWFSVRAHAIPLFFAFDNRGLMVRHLLRLRYLFQLIILTFTNPRSTSSERWATESWILARKR